MGPEPHPRDAVRDHLVLAVNGQLHRVGGEAAFGTLSDFLRRDRRLIGTKIVCSEGDCGACSVLVGEPRRSEAPSVADGGGATADGLSSGALRYRAIDSCIAFLHQLDGCHVITVEGLAGRAEAQSLAELHPVQRSMVECFGSQCGFCTPGFVIAITDLLAAQDRTGSAELDDEELRVGLGGNLCRCTGYAQIVDAVREAERSAQSLAPAACADEQALAAVLGRASREPVRLEHRGRVLELPRDEQRLLAARAARPAARLVAGGTDLGVRFNKGQLSPSEDVIDLGGVAGFGGVRLLAAAAEDAAAGGRLVCGATARLSELLDAIEGLPSLADLRQVLRRFGGPQIRNLGTVGGNLVNASPIADSLPFLYVASARIELVSQRGARWLPIEQFYRGYKQLDLEPDELLRTVEVRVPDPGTGERLLLLKASRRRDLDISTFTAALWMRLEGERIDTVRLAFGGVGPTVLRLPRSEESLRGQRLEMERFRMAGEVASSEIRPISDVRGAAAYRRLLARQVMESFFRRLHGEQEEVA